MQARDRDSAKIIFDQRVSEGVSVVHLRPYWREARIDASSISYQESFDANTGMHNDSRHINSLSWKNETFCVSNRLPSRWCTLWQPSGGFIGWFDWVWPLLTTPFLGRNRMYMFPNSFDSCYVMWARDVRYALCTIGITLNTFLKKTVSLQKRHAFTLWEVLWLKSWMWQNGSNFLRRQPFWKRFESGCVMFVKICRDIIYYIF